MPPFFSSYFFSPAGNQVGDVGAIAIAAMLRPDGVPPPYGLTTLYLQCAKGGGGGRGEGGAVWLDCGAGP